MKNIQRTALFLCITITLSTLACAAAYATNEPEWATNIPELPEYDYSFAVIGDTQNLMLYNNYDNYVSMYDWIIENKDTQKIKYVIGLGDITESCTEKELEYAKNAKTKLCDNNILNSFIRGNHDKNETLYKTYFSYSQFKSTVSGTYKNDMLNTYTKFSVGNVNYIVFALTVGPDDDILNWVSDIAEQNPDHNIIITTHIYLTDKGTHTKAPSPNHKIYYGTSGGEQIWNKLVKEHENIVMVLSGHYQLSRIAKTQRTGTNGNVVTEMMIDAELPDETYKNIGGLGLVAMFYFSDNGRRLDVRYYSTVHQKYYMDINQFSMNLNVVGLPQEDNTPPETTVTTAPITTSTPITTEPITTNTPTNAYPTTNTSQNKTPTTDISTTDTPITDIPTINTPVTNKPSTSIDKTTEIITSSPTDTSVETQSNNQDKKDTTILIIILITGSILVSGTVTAFITLKKKKSK